MIEIDLTGSSEAVEKNKGRHEAALPENSIPVGNPGKSDFHVYIKQDVYHYLETYSQKDTSIEVGSFLLGYFAAPYGKNCLIISDCIEAKYTDASASTLTFTHKTWDYVHKTMESEYSDLKIVGWHHTHPGYGIFLSEYDLFIQKNFFDLSWQVAYVIDPVSQTRGFFQWEGDDIVSSRGFYIYDEPGTWIEVPADASDAPLSETDKVAATVESDNKLSKEASDVPASESEILAAESAGNLLSGNVSLLSVVLAILLLIMTGFAAILFVDHNRIKQDLDQVERKISIAELEDMSVSELDDWLKENEVAFEESSPMEEGETSEGEGPPSSNQSFNTITFYEYTVKPEDTLPSICSYFGLEYQNNRSLILRVNGLNSPDDISKGQVLLIPAD